LIQTFQDLIFLSEESPRPPRQNIPLLSPNTNTQDLDSDAPATYNVANSCRLPPCLLVETQL